MEYVYNLKKERCDVLILKRRFNASDKTHKTQTHIQTSHVLYSIYIYILHVVLSIYYYLQEIIA